MVTTSIVFFLLLRVSPFNHFISPLLGQEISLKCREGSALPPGFNGFSILIEDISPLYVMA